MSERHWTCAIASNLPIHRLLNYRETTFTVHPPVLLSLFSSLCVFSVENGWIQVQILGGLLIVEIRAPSRLCFRVHWRFSPMGRPGTLHFSNFIVPNFVTFSFFSWFFLFWGSIELFESFSECNVVLVFAFLHVGICLFDWFVCGCRCRVAEMNELFDDLVNESEILFKKLGDFEFLLDCFDLELFDNWLR